jgi:hypothetical protein
VNGVTQVTFGKAIVSRLTPAMPPENYVTYGWAMPLRTHWQQATCQETNCQAYLRGWTTTLDESTAEGQQHAVTIKSLRGYKYTAEKLPSGLTRYTFPAGQNCFVMATHRKQNGRPPLLYVKNGDWRGNPHGTPTRIHSYADDWAEDFSEHQAKLALLISRG